MKRTFRGWLLKYCCSLTGLSTTSLKKLCAASTTKAPQACEAVFLYALELDRVDDLLRYADGLEIYSEWKDMSKTSSRYRGRAEAFLRKRGNAIPVRYTKVLRAYDSIEASVANDRVVVAQMARQTLAALNAAGISRYRLAKDLSLNEGNVYAWLAGDATKISRGTARRAWNYALSFNHVLLES